MAGPIRISILADGSNANRAFASVSANAGGMGVRVGKAGKALGLAVAAGTAVAGAAALKFAADSVKSASDAQQSLGATETVFGKYARSVVKRSNEAATAVGISANEYRELSNVVGASLTGAGVSIKEASSLTADLNKRAADMAATFGGTTREAVEAVSSALRGETDPIERYGVSIKQADVNARLAALGQDELTGAAAKQAEMQARLDLIFSKTAKTQGAFAKESDTLAHQQQVLGAQFENVKAKIGSALLPVLTQAFSYVNTTVVPAVEKFGAAMRDKLAPVFDRIKEAADQLAQRLQPVADWFRSNPDLIKGAGIALGIAAAAAGVLALAMGAVAVATSPITLTVLAIAALGAGFAYAYKHSETFRNGVQAIGAAFQSLIATVTPIVQQIVAAVVGKFQEMRPQLQAIWQSIQSIVRSALSIIQSVIKAVTGAIKAIWQNFGGTILRFITTTLTNVVNVIKGVFKIIQGVFKVVSSALKGDWSGLWDGIKMIVSGAVGVVKGIISQAWNVIRTLTSAAWTALKLVVSKAWDGIKSAVTSGISGAVGLVRGLPGKITSALGSLGSLLEQAGTDLIQGLIDGITSKVDDLRGYLNQVTDLIPDWKGPADKDRNLLTPAGQMIMQGLIDGISDQLPNLETVLGRITTRVPEAITKVRDALETERDRIAGIVDSLSSKFDSLSTSVADAFTPDLFQAGSAGEFIRQSRDAIGSLRHIRAAWRKLTSWGINPEFLSQLFASGNGALIIDMAKGSRKGARTAARLSRQVGQLAGGLGNQVATERYGPKLDKTNQLLADVRGLIKGLPSVKDLTAFTKGARADSRLTTGSRKRRGDIAEVGAGSSGRRVSTSRSSRSAPDAEDLLAQLIEVVKDFTREQRQRDRETVRTMGAAVVKSGDVFAERLNHSLVRGVRMAGTRRGF
ncbi:phage tail protein [Nocardioides bruguierae]|uniref:Phage-related protein n=1 Tax=Nocardioides bruguierae TaxID=2945102 RepID=A0A9X2D5P8_9ACTN|nr:hypothetical protein [Nocardioides bruguierae]MCM0618779.1 hypothetical protein [Nocardioides bruguierae]